LTHCAWEVGEHESILSSGSKPQKLDRYFFSEYGIKVVGLHHISYTMEETMVEFLIFTSLFCDFIQELTHRNDRDTQVDRESNEWSSMVIVYYLLMISSAKTLGGVKNATFGAEGHLLINPLSVLKRPFFALRDSLCNILF
jgi:hypothetical protein